MPTEISIGALLTSEILSLLVTQSFLASVLSSRLLLPHYHRNVVAVTFLELGSTSATDNPHYLWSWLSVNPHFVVFHMPLLKAVAFML